MKKTAILAAEMVYPYPKLGVNLLKRYADLKTSHMSQDTLPLKLNHGGKKVGTFSNPRGNDALKRLEIDLEIDEKKIPSSLYDALQKLDKVPISGEFGSLDIMLPGLHETGFYDGYQSSIEWTGAALIWNSEQVARCGTDRCGVNVDAGSYITEAPKRVEIKRYFDGELHIINDESDKKMEKLQEQIDQLKQEKQDAVDKLEAYKQQVEQEKYVQDVITKTGATEDAVKDLCKLGLDGFVKGYEFRKAQDAESSGEQKEQSSQKCPEGQRWDPQQNKCVNITPTKKDVGDGTSQKKQDATPQPVPTPPPLTATPQQAVIFKPDESRYLGEK